MNAEGVQLFRLQLVDAEDGKVCKFAAGGNVELDLVQSCAKAVRSVYLAPTAHVVQELDIALPLKWYHFGLVPKSKVLAKSTEILADWHSRGEREIDWNIARAITAAIFRFKEHMIGVLRDRMA